MGGKLNINIELPKRTLPLKENALFLLSTDHLGGAERVTITLVEQAAKEQLFQQIDLYILSKNPSGSLTHLEKYDNINIIHTNDLKIRNGILPFIHYLSDQEYDFSFSTFTILNAICCVLRRRSILKTKRLVIREPSMTYTYKLSLKSVIARLAIRFYGNQDLLVCQTNRMARSFNKYTRDRMAPFVRVLTNPIDLNRIAKSKNEETNVLSHIPDDVTKIVWCGRFIKVKRAERALQTMDRLRSLNRQDVHLVIIGDGMFRGEIENEIVKNNTQDMITLCGYQPNPINIMAQCQYGLLTSDIEGSPNVIPEMLAAGVRRVVTTNCTGDLEVIPGVHVAKDNSPATLAQCIIEALNKPRPKEIDDYLQRRNAHNYLQKLIGNS